MVNVKTYSDGNLLVRKSLNHIKSDYPESGDGIHFMHKKDTRIIFTIENKTKPQHQVIVVVRSIKYLTIGQIQVSPIREFLLTGRSA
jgi:hypothetical protein